MERSVLLPRSGRTFTRAGILQWRGGVQPIILVNGTGRIGLDWVAEWVELRRLLSMRLRFFRTVFMLAGIFRPQEAIRVFIWRFGSCLRPPCKWLMETIKRLFLGTRIHNLSSCNKALTFLRRL